jgi:hypothetical protein
MGVAALQLTACNANTTTTVKPDDAAQKVTELVASQNNNFRPTDVTCPANVPAKVGGKFECQFTGPRSVKYVAHMKIAKVDGQKVTLDIEVDPAK